VSFSLGISNILWSAVFLVTYSLNIPMQGGYLEGGGRGHLLFGAFLGMGLILLYVGRRYYATVLLNAFWIPTADRLHRGIVWACRAALLAGAGMVGLLMLMIGLHWLLAVLFVLLTGLMFLVIARISAESGLFFVQPYWHPVGILLGLFGFVALGPQALLVLGLLCSVFTIDPRICLMPLAANALRLSEPRAVRPGRLGRWMIVAVLLALVFGTLFTIYVQYNEGGTKYSWAKSTSSYHFNLLISNLGRAGGMVQPGQGFLPGKIDPDPLFLWAAGAGLLLVLLTSALRLRFTWWPIHPVLFLVWGTFPMLHLAASFLVGWLIKVLVTRLGGSHAYRRGKALFVGAVAGEFVAGIFWSGMGLLYFLKFGQPGAEFKIHP